VNAKSVSSLTSASPDYLRCRLSGYPLGTRYPQTASELQQWMTWEAAPYEVSTLDAAAIQVNDITETLVYHLLSALLIGSEFEGDTVMMRFSRYEYGADLLTGKETILGSGILTQDHRAKIKDKSGCKCCRC
jgi:hypothetical protein